MLWYRLMNDFAIVDRCYSLVSFDSKRAWLESHGITVYSDSEHTISVNPWYAHAIGGIRLKVAAADETRARELLAQIVSPASSNEEGKPPYSLKWPIALALLLGLVVGIYNGYREESWSSGLHTFLLVGFMVFLTSAYALKQQER